VGSHRNNNLGSLRLVGAMAVLLGHSFVLTLGLDNHDPISAVTREVAGYRLGLPGLGVAMFFAISGYLVTQSFIRRRGVVAYAEARLLRIYPALILAVALTLLWGLFISSYGLDYATSKQTLAYGFYGASLIDVRYALPGVFESNPLPAVNGSLWTLPVELRMYAFVGLAGVLGVLGRRALFNLSALALIAVGTLWPESPLLADPVHIRAAVFFLVGAALYVNRDWIPLRAGGVVVVVVAAFVASLTPAYPLVFAIAFSYTILWLGLRPRGRLPDLAAHGDLSYGTYLYAFPATQFWVYALSPSSPWLVALLTLVTVLPLAWLSWRLVERPALARKGTVLRSLSSSGRWTNVLSRKS